MIERRSILPENLMKIFFIMKWASYSQKLWITNLLPVQWVWINIYYRPHVLLSYNYNLENLQWAALSRSTSSSDTILISYEHKHIRLFLLQARFANRDIQNYFLSYWFWTFNICFSSSDLSMRVSFNFFQFSIWLFELSSEQRQCKHRS